MLLRYIFVLLLATLACSPSSFADSFCHDVECAREAKPYADLSRFVYTEGMEGNGWKLVRDENGIVDFHWPLEEKLIVALRENYVNIGFDNGFYAALYRNENNGQYVLAYRGTQELVDWGSNVAQLSGWSDLMQLYNQYNTAVWVAETVKSKYSNSLILTGHSLGGGLATWTAHKIGLKAYVFNTARINKKNQDQLGSNPGCSIKSYIAYSSLLGRELVSSAGEKTALTTDYLVDIPDSMDFFKYKNILDLHRMLYINAALIFYAKNGENATPPPPSSVPKSWQENYISSPGGSPIIQSVWGLTTGGTATLKVQYIEVGSVETIPINAGDIDSNGHWTVSYYPTFNKPIGHYQWWVIDNATNKETNKITYQIVRPYVEGETPWYGNYGEEIVDTTPPPPECLPDFVAKRAWITKSENGADKYVFESGDKAWINVKVKNEGCANSPQDISVWYMLSKGEKEDDHHDWVKIGTDTIRSYELAVGQDRWEKSEFTVPTEPGKYNIVACADRIALYDNGDGAVPEEHKSNNCSTEAVFTVLPKNNPPVGYFDNATCDSLDGWAKDPDTSSSVFIRFYKDGPAGTGIYIGSTFADIYRGDLPYTDKEHGFSFTLPDSLNDGASHQIYAYAIDDAGGTNTLLTNSPKTVQCGLTGDQLAAVMSVIQNIIMEDIGPPDLSVINPSVSKTSLAPGESLTFSATAKNGGTASSAASTLRWYRSADATISTADTQLGSQAVGALSAGQTSTQSATLAAPSAAGTYWLGACIDAVSGETNTGNNCSSGVQITVTAPPAAPDLSVINPSVSKTSLTPGESLTFSATAKNGGTASSAATTLRWYRSTDAAITTADTQLGSQAVAALSAGQTSAQSATLAAPSAAGTYWLGACIDAVSGETNTGNNCSSGVQITVTAPPAAPDLSVINPSASKTSLAPGESLTFSATAKNGGTASSAATTSRWYRSADATISTADTQLGSQAVGALSAGQTSALSATLTAPSAAGTYWIGACIDAVSGETNTGNNCSSGVQITVTAGKPDLIVSSLNFPSQFDAGNSGSATAGFYNQGTAASVATTATCYYINKATQAVSGAVCQMQVPALAVNQTASRTATLTAPCSEGAYQLKVCVNSGANAESNTGNNCMYGDLSVVGNCPKKAFLPAIEMLLKSK